MEKLDQARLCLEEITVAFECRSARDAFDSDNQHRFESALAAVTPRRTAALERLHLQKFQDERLRQYEAATQVLHVHSVFASNPHSLK